MKHTLAACLLTLAAASAAGAAARPSVLLSAVQAGDIKAVKVALAQKADVNAPAPDGMTPLHWAVQNNDAAIVDALVAAGADVTAVTRYGIQPISLAAGNGHAIIAERLLKAGADANAVMPDGETPLMRAARNGNPDLVKVLLAHGAKIDAVEKARGQNALMWAAAEGNVAAIKVLVEAGADLNAHSKMRGIKATSGRSTGDGKPVDNPPAAKPAPKAPEPPKAPAAPKPYDEADDPGQGNLLVLKSKFPKGRDISLNSYGGRTVTEGLTPMLFAVRSGRAEAVKALLDAGAKLEEAASDGTTPLFMAIVNAHWELATYLLEKGADPNANGRGITPLHQLVVTRRLHLGHLPNPTGSGSVDSITVAKLLIAKGADINARMTVSSQGDGYRNRLNRKGATPFLLAAKGIDPVMMRLLVSLGADPKIPTVENITALEVAAGVAQFNPGEDAGTEDESLDAVRYCIEELGMDVNHVDDNGETALHGAAYKGFNRLTQYLVDKGAKLDAQNVLGWTPLTIANGVMYTNFYKSQRHTAALLVKLMKERGLEASDALDISGAGYVRDLKPKAANTVPVVAK
ncbi:MAG: ankyrin repeat domain-containing protein [Vicinamibacterales bacterium]